MEPRGHHQHPGCSPDPRRPPVPPNLAFPAAQSDCKEDQSLPFRLPRQLAKTLRTAERFITSAKTCSFWINFKTVFKVMMKDYAVRFSSIKKKKKHSLFFKSLIQIVPVWQLSGICEL